MQRCFKGRAAGFIRLSQGLLVRVWLGGSSWHSSLYAAGSVLHVEGSWGLVLCVKCFKDWRQTVIISYTSWRVLKPHGLMIGVGSTTSCPII